MYIKKEQIEEATTFEEMYCFYLKVDRITDKNISAPYREDKKPSLKVYKDTWKYNDHGELTEKPGNIYSLVAKINNLTLPSDFNKVLNIINDDMCLGIEEETTFKLPDVPFTEEGLTFWKQYNVSKEALELFNVSQLQTSDKRFGFRYNTKISDKKYKDYILQQKNKKKEYYNKFTGNDIIGIEFLDKEESIIITAGEKDRIVLYANTGKKGVNFISETHVIKKEQIEQLKNKAKNIFICYDNDPTGRESIKKLTELYPKDLIELKLPNGNNIKDIADFFQAKNTKQSFIDLMDTALKLHRINNNINLWENDKCYWSKKYKNKTSYDDRISNFVIENPYLITSEKTPAKRLIKITTATSSTDYLAIDSANFSSLQRFKAMIESEGNFFWSGKDTELNNFKELVLNRSVVVRSVETLGFDEKSESYIFRNCLLTNKGEILEPNNFSVVEHGLNGIWIDKDYQDDNILEYKENKNVNFQIWFNQLEKAYGTTKAFFGAAHVAISISFDIIAKEFNHCPLLFIYGRPGSGKTVFAKLLRKPFFPVVENQVTFKSGASSIALSNIISQFSNALIHFDEFKNDPSEVSAYIERLKNIYDLIGRKKSTKSNDNKTYSDKVLSATVVTGEHIPKDEALGQRSILLTFDKKDNQDTEVEFEKLQNISEKGLSSIIKQVFAIRNKIKAEIRQKRQQNSIEIKKLLVSKGLKLDIRVLNNFALYLTIFDFLHDNNILNIDRAAILDSIVTIIRKQIELFEDINPIDRFWTVFNDYIDSNQIAKEFDYTIVNNDVLVLSHKGIDAILDIARKNKRDLPDKSTMTNYLKQDDCYIKRDKNNNKARFGNNKNRGVFFDLVRLNKLYHVELPN